MWTSGDHPELDPGTYGLTIWDLDRAFFTGGFGGKPQMPLREILTILRDTYCSSIGVEYMNIQDPEQKRWLQERMEPIRNRREWSPEENVRALRSLTAAEGMEKFLHTRFIGHKRFSLEGAETLMPILDALMSHCAALGATETVIGMAHRGRLNVLANIVGKSVAKIFSEFEGYVDPSTTQGPGDVKYHLGATGRHQTPAGVEIIVSVAPNPSQDPDNAYAWFNLGSNLVYFERYSEASSAYDTARNLGLPQRMLRYQFGPFFAYFHAALTTELLAVTEYTLQRTPNSEEALLWHGWALYRMGKKVEAIADWQKALEHRPGYQDAQNAIDFAASNP